MTNQQIINEMLEGCKITYHGYFWHLRIGVVCHTISNQQIEEMEDKGLIRIGHHNYVIVL